MKRRIFFFVGLTGLLFCGTQVFFAYRQPRESSEQSLISEKKCSTSDYVNIDDFKKKSFPLEYLSFTKNSSANWVIHLNNLIVVQGVTSEKEIFYQGKKYLFSEKKEINKGLFFSFFHEANVTDVPIAINVPSSLQGHPVAIQAVSFNKFDKPCVTSAILFKGFVTSENEAEKPPLDGALLFYFQDNKWFFAGIYDAQYQKVKPLDVPFPKVIFSNNKNRAVVNEAVEKFFVLENSYLQLVFSNKGASIEGINLSFDKKRDNLSIVKEIEVDRKLKAIHPSSSTFPGFPHILSDSKIINETTGVVGRYYPLLRRVGLINPKKNNPNFYAFNVVSDRDDEAIPFYNVVEFSNERIVFEGYQFGRLIKKEFSLSEMDPYCINCSVSVDNGNGLWITSGIPEVEMLSNAHMPFVKCAFNKKQSLEVEKIRLPKVNNQISVGSSKPNWIVNSNGYFGIIVQPLSSTAQGYRINAYAATNAPSRFSLLNTKQRKNPAGKYVGYEVLIPLASSKEKSQAFRIYAGPFDKQILKSLDAKIATETGVNPKFLLSLDSKGFFSFISLPFSKFLFLVMQLFQYMTHSWGLSIILLTIFLRLVLYPLNAWSLRSMRRMQLLSPKLQEIQKRYKGEQRKAQLETVALYKKHKVNPFMGCVPILIQIPFLLAMFDLLKTSFPLRGTKFISGWIDNLTSPDVIFRWSEQLPLIGNELHLLPLLLGVVMFIQQKISSKKTSIEEMSDQQRQQKAMGTLMTGFFTIMFYNAPSGLNLYWLCSMLLGILQQWLTNRSLENSCSGILETADSKIISGKK
ncbi:membrane protein insertase YidC [Candidatus Clavichlamydia salmonicola]|uniref:membrane protein insertase YidC n=1 Tax=Candidatus Clavichlamydia salmonicola TaxID=469812 RepID=UPI001891DAE9|nr:membrane protein insertase YidC [Candidatus Clavichlamydia salmonicola]